MRPLAVGLLVLLACGGPPPATTFTVTEVVATQSSTDARVSVRVSIQADGRLRSGAGVVLHGANEVAQLGVVNRSADLSSMTLTADFSPEAVFSPTTNVALGGVVPVALKLRITSSDLPAVDADVPSTDLGCGVSKAICAGKCSDLSTDKRNCGACGSPCDLQLTSAVYEGRCRASRCLWPGLTVSGSPAPCAMICANSTFKTKPLVCTAACAYVNTVDSAYPAEGQGSNVGAVKYQNGTKVISTCPFDPTANDSMFGSFKFQMCCCEAAP